MRLSLIETHLKKTGFFMYYSLFLYSPLIFQNLHLEMKDNVKKILVIYLFLFAITTINSG